MAILPSASMITIASGADSSRPRNCVSPRFRSVTSRATTDAPITWPYASWIAEIVSETWIRLPSLRTRTVSKCSMRSPRESRSKIAGSSSTESSGTSIAIGCPIASSAV